MEVFIFIGAIGVVILLGRYAIAEGQRIESQKRFMKNMDTFDSNKNKQNEKNK
tara:strand:- start:2840 stop:2998 length:159 start_codon:yes stop_codon:yes gene_type:complete